MRRGGKHRHAVFDEVDDREQAARVGRSVLDVADVGNATQPLDHGKRKVRALEIRVGVEHDRERHRVRHRLEVGVDAVIGNRKVGFEDRENAVAADALHLARLEDGVGDRRRRHAGYDRNAPVGRLHDDFDDAPPLRPVEIGEFAGRPKRREAVDAGRN